MGRASGPEKRLETATVLSGALAASAAARLVRRRIVKVDLVRLLEPDRITAADRTAAQDGGINADVDPVVLGRRTQDAWIPG